MHRRVQMSRFYKNPNMLETVVSGGNPDNSFRIACGIWNRNNSVFEEHDDLVFA